MNDKEPLQIYGTVEEIIFRNDSNGYTVIKMLSEGTDVTAHGLMAAVNTGDELRLFGAWENHPSYGRQFSFEYYEQYLPSTADSILKYLSTGAIKGIGKATARRLVEAFGDKTLEVMQNDPLRTSQVKGISVRAAENISAEMKKNFGMREVMLWLERFHISTQEMVRIWKTLGAETIALVEENPYILCSSEIEVPFNRADNIAAVLKKSSDDIFRIRAGINHVIKYNSCNGHTCLPKEKLIAVAAEFMRLEPSQVSAILEEMLLDGSLVYDEINDRAFVFMPKLYRSETFAAERLSMILKFPCERISGVEHALEIFEKEHGICYAELQRKAIIEALSGGLLILTGGPGTGKTTTLNGIIALFTKFGLKVALAAPTGRAAQRMSEVTSREAKTLHRLLEVEWDKNDTPVFKRNERNLLECDALIIDELSMVDAQLFECVMRALPLGCRLIMVGDSDQLPSVGPGNVLGDLIDSGRIPVVQLTEIFRQSMQSLIVTNAHRIVHGEMPDISRTDSDFFFMVCPERERIASTIVDLCARRLPASYGYSAFNNIQVLCPGRNGDLGVTEMNKRLQQALNPSRSRNEEISVPLRSYFQLLQWKLVMWKVLWNYSMRKSMKQKIC